VQTVDERTQPLFSHLVRAFGRLTGVPLLLNTSFNESEPIVESPAQALDCFLRTDMDALALGRTMVRRRRAA
jgi:carbamoyltransferase